MREIGAFEAKNTLGALLDLVEHGEEVVITRRGKPVARLVSEPRVIDRERPAAQLPISSHDDKASPSARGFQ